MFDVGQDVVQYDVELLKALILLKFLYAVQDGQDVFNLSIYKNRKSLNFNDFLKKIYNRKIV